MQAITEYLNTKDVELVKPNYGEDGDNLPFSTIARMYDEEVMKAPNEEEQAEEANFIEGGLQAKKEFNANFLVESEENKGEVGAEPNVNMPQVSMPNPQMPMATGQVTAQQVSALFPNDPLSAQIAARRQT